MKGRMSDPNCERNAPGRTIRNTVKLGPSATTFTPTTSVELRKPCKLAANAARSASVLGCSLSDAIAETPRKRMQASAVVLNGMEIPDAHRYSISPIPVVWLKF